MLLAALVALAAAVQEAKVGLRRQELQTLAAAVGVVALVAS
jgi:hypothetical protein